MVSVMMGTVVEVQGSSMKIQDLISGDIIQAEAAPEIAFEVQAGEDGVFLGSYQAGGSFLVKRLNMRKFLRPLYEEDLMEASGQETFVQVVNDPFFKAFRELENTPYMDAAWKHALDVLKEEEEAGLPPREKMEVEMVEEPLEKEEDDDL